MQPTYDNIPIDVNNAQGCDNGNNAEDDTDCVFTTPKRRNEVHEEIVKGKIESDIEDKEKVEFKHTIHCCFIYNINLH